VGSRLDELAAVTPATRDRYVDFLRAASIVAVVFGHWFIGIVHREDDLLYLTSAVGATSGLWLGTWFFQVMPIFFFVGGFSNLTAYESFRRRGETAGAFVRSRALRLLRPSLGVERPRGERQSGQADQRAGPRHRAQKNRRSERCTGSSSPIGSLAKNTRARSNANEAYDRPMPRLGPRASELRNA